jgi:hypothetical protein
MTPRWDPSNPLHKSLAHEIEFGNGIPSMRPTTEVHEALLACGYDIEVEEDLAERPDPIEWYYPLEGDIKKAQTLWDYFTVARISPTGRFLNHKFMWLLETFGVMPKGTHGITIALDVAAESLVKAGQLKVTSSLRHLSAVMLTIPRSSRPCIWLSHISRRHKKISTCYTPKMYTLLKALIQYIWEPHLYNCTP